MKIIEPRAHCTIALFEGKFEADNFNPVPSRLILQYYGGLWRQNRLYPQIIKLENPKTEKVLNQQNFASNKLSYYLMYHLLELMEADSC